MVDMRVSEKNGVYHGRVDRQRLVFKHIYTLLHTAVYKDMMPVYLDKRTASGDLVRRAEKSNFHKAASCSDCSHLLYYKYNAPAHIFKIFTF
jgi:hypothetical protein